MKESEDKNLITNEIGRLLSLTDFGKQVRYIGYNSEEEIVHITIGYKKIQVNVNADSGIALIIDVFRAINKEL